MTDFLIKSSLSLGVLLIAYYLFLEKEKMHQFNRFYLLFGLLFSFTIPFITIEIIQKVYTHQETTTLSVIPMEEITSIPIIENPTNYWLIAAWSLYGVITLALLLQFVLNIWKLNTRTKTNPTINYKNAKLVLVKEKTLPYTFLDHIFINETDYHDRKIEDELYTHELIHVNQKHTLDILFIEMLKVIFWFNPIFIFYKKAIQLNHEFLADEKVVKSHKNVPFYQNLLLSKANANPTYYLASNLNYSVTKKRLIMMTKTASTVRSISKKLLLIPLFSGIIFFGCLKTIAQEKAIIYQEKSLEKKSTKESKRDAYYAGVRIIGKNKQDNTSINKIYEELTPEEKKTYLDYVPDPYIKKQPSDKEYNNFKNSKKYAIWIDEKNVPNEALENYSPKDFAYFIGSNVYKNARRKNFPQPFQYHLYTHNYFDKNLKNSHLKFSGKTINITIGNEQRKENQKKTSTIKTKNQDPSAIYSTAGLTEKPEFPGGMENFYKFVGENYTRPKTPEEVKLAGKVYITFIVEADGNLSDFKVLRDIGYGTGEEAVRVLKLSPKWTPGEINGEAVRTLYSLPIAIQPKA